MALWLEYIQKSVKTYALDRGFIGFCLKTYSRDLWDLWSEELTCQLSSRVGVSLTWSRDDNINVFLVSVSYLRRDRTVFWETEVNENENENENFLVNENENENFLVDDNETSYENENENF